MDKQIDPVLKELYKLGYTDLQIDYMAPEDELEIVNKGIKAPVPEPNSSPKRTDLCIPFSNGTEFMDWINHNCDKCKRHYCYSQIALQKGSVTGYITMKIAHRIGFQSSNRNNNGMTYLKLNDKCDIFTSTPVKRKKKLKDKNNLKLF